ncbi:hypothetical protein KC968_03385 [Candidatus Saccharibacteria bacterium]|nr:hypothetical protein [Candidatus Saccharibacteria bacterium]
MQSIIPSGSTNGRPIAISATTSPGTVIHTCTSTSGETDEVYVWLSNIDSSSREVTVQIGGTTTADQWIVGIPAKQGGVLVVPGLRLNGGAVIRAFCATANVINATAIVNRIVD